MSLKSFFIGKVALAVSLALMFSAPRPARAVDLDAVGLAIAVCGVGVAAAATAYAPVSRYYQRQRIRRVLEARGGDGINLEENLALALRLLRNVPHEEAAILRVIGEVETPELLSSNLRWHVEQFEATPDGFFDPQVWMRSIDLRHPVIESLQTRGWRFLAVRGGSDQKELPLVTPDYERKLFTVRLSPQAATVLFDLLEMGLLFDSLEQLYARRKSVERWVCDQLLGGDQPCDPLATIQGALSPEVILQIVPGPGGVQGLILDPGVDGANVQEIAAALKLMQEQAVAAAQTRALTECVVAYLVGKNAQIQVGSAYHSLISRRPEFRARLWQDDFSGAEKARMSVVEYCSRRLLQRLGLSEHPRASEFLPTLIKASLDDFE